MKRYLTCALLGLLGIASIGYSREIPDGLEEIMEQLQTDPNVKYGLESAKKWRFVAENVNLKQFRVGLPVEVYTFDYKVFDTCDANIDLEKLIKRENMWHIPVKVRGKYTYSVQVRKKGDSIYTFGCGAAVIGCRGDWDKIRRKYPEHTGIRPVLIRDGQHKYLHFPSKKPNNLLYLRPDSYTDSLSLIASKSVDSLDDASTILKYRKKEWEQNREKRERFFKEHPGVFNKRGGKR